MTKIDTVVITDHGSGGYARVVCSGPDANPFEVSIPRDRLRHLTSLLVVAVTTCKGAEPATLVIPSATGLDQLVGWRVAGLEADTGWYQLTGHSLANPRRVHLCVLDRLAGDQGLFAPGWDAAQITAHLRMYRDLTGVPFYATPGVSGVALAHQLIDHPSNPGRRPRWVLPAETHLCIIDKHEIPGPLDLIWRPHRLHNEPAPAGHRWDVRSQYLAAAQSAILGTDAPEHTGPIPFNTGQHGWWRVALVDGLYIPSADGRAVDKVPDFNSEGPPLIEAAGQPDGSYWLTTPMAGYLTRLGVQFEVWDAYVAPSGQRHLRSWGHILRDAVYTTTGDPDTYPDELRDTLKSTYAETIGLFNRTGGRVYRPDWRATIIDLARVLLYQKISRVWEVTGAWPVRIDRDSIWYADSVVTSWHKYSGQRFGELLEDGSGYIGKFRYEGYEDEGQGNSHEH